MPKITLKRIINRLRRALAPGYKKESYAQSGEDLIVAQALEGMGITKPSYLDIGAYHPYHFSNTYLFYKRGASGVCIEPNPDLCALINEKRPRDICFAVGVSPGNGDMTPFYVMRSRTLSTFSSEAASKLSRSIVDIQALPMTGIATVLQVFLSGVVPDFLSIDIEGDELGILKKIDWPTFRPKVLCVETLTYTEDKTEKKQTETIKFMVDQGYFIYGDTYINTIFVDQAAWEAR